MNESLRIQFCWETSVGSDWKLLVTVIQLPSGALETAVNNQDLDNKIQYILDNYDDDFCLNTNPQVKVVGYILL